MTRMKHWGKRLAVAATLAAGGLLATAGTALAGFRWTP